jgi:hypothetical protein
MYFSIGVLSQPWSITWRSIEIFNLIQRTLWSTLTCMSLLCMALYTVEVYQHWEVPAVFQLYQISLGVAGKPVSHLHIHSAGLRTEQWLLYRNTGMMETDRVIKIYRDPVISDIHRVAGSISFTEPEIDCHHIIVSSNEATPKMFSNIWSSFLVRRFCGSLQLGSIVSLHPVPSHFESRLRILRARL